MYKLAQRCLILIGLFSKISFSQQSIDSYVLNSSNNVFTVVASSTNGLSSPVDIDFYPDQTKRPFQLWILNQGTESSGGSTVIVSNANKSSRTFKYVKDGNAWHFMSVASALAFGDSLWATSADVLDANHTTGKYTGPTLWSSDLNIYGVVGNPVTTQFNGSHLDMIHQSPYGKGIAFEKDMVYWVLDGYEGNLKRYDYVQTHQPGGADHSAGQVRVYNDFQFTKHSSLPSHIVIDANKKYLYGCDPVGKRIFRVDITTGTYNGIGTKVNTEPLAEYSEYLGLVTKDIVTSGLVSPVGIDVYGNRLIVTDNGTDEIIIYDISKNFIEVGRIKLVYATNPDPLGIKVGPDGKIYFADKANKKVYMMENNAVFPLAINSKLIEERDIHIYPNPTNDKTTLELNNESTSVNVVNILGEIILTQNFSNISKAELDLSGLQAGQYIIQIISNKSVKTTKLIKL